MLALSGMALSHLWPLATAAHLPTATPLSMARTTYFLGGEIASPTSAVITKGKVPPITTVQEPVRMSLQTSVIDWTQTNTPARCQFNLAVLYQGLLGLEAHVLGVIYLVAWLCLGASLGHSAVPRLYLGEPW
ncbi:hypothetical protein QBC33DRAFT_25456 [Phialemonium atrogriseum]|uniref:Uncharacterized protein n=1 Tax=Phialemonium atrogriseum TaxID=1093897 RepID=A0AAJ0C9V1_9PEZI|nr:uncharacterized protein QBC33DRAFT_25456 [Phialemonium atrogriseum]KAK1772651.1 hypothetical protein QBC33DRAFT_25456 [Phialemonium atrogriseum]